MLAEIHEIQQRFMSDYGFPAGETGLPQNVPDGAYPMIVGKRVDLVKITNGKIDCCNFIGTKKELKAYQAEMAKANA